MTTRVRVEKIYRTQTETFSNSPPFQALEKGTASPTEYELFLTNLGKTHLQSPKILGFLFAISPPKSSENVKHNLLEELGLEESEESHPDLLRKMMRAAGFDSDALSRLEQEAQEEVRRMCQSPLMYGTIKEFGLHIMLEVFSFEWMLSRLASRIGDFLVKHRGYRKEDLLWLFFHSEKDIEHAEEALDTLTEYVDYYGISQEDLDLIIEATFRENIFIKHYFAKRPGA
jgi:pyrroloquinoline quinone (PQQ) biosynthesis protein C